MNEASVGLNIIDYSLLLVIALSVGLGIWRGLVREVFSILAWVFALVIAVLFSSELAKLLQPWIANKDVLAIASFLITFFIGLTIGTLASRFVSGIVKLTGLGLTDRMMGMVFGAARGSLIVAIIVMLVNMTPFSTNTYWIQSYMVKQFIPLAGWIAGFIPDMSALFEPIKKYIPDTAALKSQLMR